MFHSSHLRRQVPHLPKEQAFSVACAYPHLFLPSKPAIITFRKSHPSTKKHSNTVYIAFCPKERHKDGSFHLSYLIGDPIHLRLMALLLLLPLCNGAEELDHFFSVVGGSL